MTNIPTTPRRFKRWLATQDIPSGLRAEANIVLRDIDCIALNRMNPDADVIIPPLRARIDAFIAKLVARLERRIEDRAMPAKPQDLIKCKTCGNPNAIFKREENHIDCPKCGAIEFIKPEPPMRRSLTIVESLRLGASQSGCLNPKTQLEAADTIEKLDASLVAIIAKLDSLDRRLRKLEE